MNQDKPIQPQCLWLTGFSGAGKSTIALALHEELRNMGVASYVLDGDILRRGLNKDLGFNDEDRVENMRRVAEVAKILVEANILVIVALISPYAKDRNDARSLFKSGLFTEIFIDTPLEVCEKRDIKGLYKRARRGEIPRFTGIDSPYEPPVSPELIIHTLDQPPKRAVDRVISYLKNHR